MTPKRAPAEESPARGLRCPCGGGTCIPIPTCPACGEQWIGEAEGRALDAATEPHVIAERRRRIAERRATVSSHAPAREPKLCACGHEFRFHDPGPGGDADDSCEECGCPCWRPVEPAPAPAPRDGPPARRIEEYPGELEFLHARIRALEEALGDLDREFGRVIEEVRFKLSGGDAPAERCSECGEYGAGMLRDAVKDAEPARARARRAMGGP